VAEATAGGYTRAAAGMRSAGLAERAVVLPREQQRIVEQVPADPAGGRLPTVLRTVAPIRDLPRRPSTVSAPPMRPHRSPFKEGGVRGGRQRGMDGGPRRVLPEHSDASLRAAFREDVTADRPSHGP
jgi:hypothetical protein